MRKRKSTSQHNDAQSETKTRKIKADRRFREVETLHQSTNVQGNLKLAEGQRLKVENNGKLQCKPKARPNFDIELMNIDDDCSAIPTINILDSDSDNDVLPEPSQIAKPSNRIPSSESSYPGSDIDMLIRDVPIEQHKDRKIVPQVAQKEPLQVCNSVDKLLAPLPSIPRSPIKRGGGTRDTGRATKRLQLRCPVSPENIKEAPLSPQPCMKV